MMRRAMRLITTTRFSLAPASNKMSDTSAQATPVKDTHAKALAINLDGSIYGSFAEIGGGQEVSRWFLTVGAASGTVAQTISAYDKAFSDDTYGAGTRYEIGRAHV